MGLRTLTPAPSMDRSYGPPASGSARAGDREGRLRPNCQVQLYVWPSNNPQVDGESCELPAFSQIGRPFILGEAEHAPFEIDESSFFGARHAPAEPQASPGTGPLIA